nr:helix-turn-helix transcriptional regulator [uncultured Pedobacter sp.]
MILSSQLKSPYFKIELRLLNCFETDYKIIEAENLSNSEYDIENFVEEMGMGRSAFYRKLKQVSGQSPNEFIRTVRLKRAVQLLKKQAGTISEISYETGCIDPAYFTRCFKKQFGVTPSEFNTTIKN